MSRLCENCRTINTCLEMGCGQGYSKKPAIEELQRQNESIQRENAALTEEVERLQRELEEANSDAERYRWLRDNANNSLHLTRNGDHTCNYVTAKQWIEEYVPEDFEDVNQKEIEAMKETNTIWLLQIYPVTPIGFYAWHGATLDAAIEAARQQKDKT